MSEYNLHMEVSKYPNICQMHDIYTWIDQNKKEEKPYIMAWKMELCQTSLYNLIQKKKAQK